MKKDLVFVKNERKELKLSQVSFVKSLFVIFIFVVSTQIYAQGALGKLPVLNKVKQQQKPLAQTLRQPSSAHKKHKIKKERWQGRDEALLRKHQHKLESSSDN